MYSFKLPDIGEGVSEGEIVKWNVSEGDHISRDQDMVEVMTDKVTVKIPSPVDGTVTKLYFGEGALVEVGNVLIDIQVTGEAAPEPAPEPEKTPEPETEEPAKEETHEVSVEKREIPEEPQGGIVPASPAVRRIAREKGVILSEVRATGPNGRVTLEDIEEASGVSVHTEQSAKEETPGEGLKAEVREPEPERQSVEEKEPEPAPEPEKAPLPTKEKGSPEEGEILVPRGLRRLIFEKMTKSKQIIPHFTIFEEIDVGPIRESISKLKSNNISVTFTPFFVKAAAIALKDFPYMNATYDEENHRYLLKKQYNMGVAIDTPDGLTVAVVKNVDSKSIVSISSEVSDLARKAREGALKLEEVQGSTFTVTNVGSIAGIMSTPIINYPEVAILGVHRTLTEITKDGAEREKMYISLSCDHRIIDGAVAARFVKRLKGLLEEPVLILSQ